MRRDSWEIPPIFGWLQSRGNVADAELLRTFNCGVGMIFVVPSEAAGATLELLGKHGERAWIAGEIVAGGSGVDIV